MHKVVCYYLLGRDQTIPFGDEPYKHPCHAAITSTTLQQHVFDEMMQTCLGCNVFQHTRRYISINNITMALWPPLNFMNLLHRHCCLWHSHYKKDETAKVTTLYVYVWQTENEKRQLSQPYHIIVFAFNINEDPVDENEQILSSLGIVSHSIELDHIYLHHQSS